MRAASISRTEKTQKSFQPQNLHRCFGVCDSCIALHTGASRSLLRHPRGARTGHGQRSCPQHGGPLVIFLLNWPGTHVLGSSGGEQVAASGVHLLGWCLPCRTCSWDRTPSLSADFARTTTKERRSSTYWPCFRIRVAIFTWATCASTPSVMPWPASNAYRATMYVVSARLHTCLVLVAVSQGIFFSLFQTGLCNRGVLESSMF